MESWERTLVELSQRMEHLEQQELLAQAEELARAERARTSFADRLRGAEGSRVRVRTATASISGRLAEIGADWIGVHVDHGARGIVPLGSVIAVDELPLRARETAEGPAVQRSLARELRGLVRDRSIIRISTACGEIAGRASGVGSDFVEIAVLASAERSARAANGAAVIPFSGIDAIVADA